MSNYNVAIKVNESNLNVSLAEFYKSVYPALFKKEIILENEFVYAIQYDIVECPVFSLLPQQKAKEILINGIKDQNIEPNLSQSLIKHIEDDIDTFGISISNITLGVKADKAGDYVFFENVSFEVSASVNFTIDGTVDIQVLTSGINIPSDPQTTKLLNSLLPKFNEKANEYLTEHPFKLPPLTLEGIDFSNPVLTEATKSLLAFTALKSSGQTVPPKSIALSNDHLSIAFDNTVTNVIVNHFIKDINSSGKESTTILGIKFSASYACGIKNAVVSYNSNNTTSVSLDAYGGGKLQAKMGILPAVTLGLTITAQPKIGASFFVNSDNTLCLSFDSIDDFKINIDIPDVPKWLTGAISQVISFLLTPIRLLISTMIKGLKIAIFPIPDFPVKIEDKNIVIKMDGIAFNVVSDDAGKKLMSVEGNMSVQKV